MEELEAYDGPRPSLDVVQGDSILLDSCALYCPIKTLLIDVVTVEKVDHIVNLVQTCHVSTLRVELEGFEDCNETLSKSPDQPTEPHRQDKSDIYRKTLTVNSKKEVHSSNSKFYAKVAADKGGVSNVTSV